MASKGYTVKTMSREQVELAVDWAAAEGWNPGRHDADCFHIADPDGFFIGLIDGEPVATISAVRYGKTFGFLGFYIVKPERRGQGLGLGIWNAAIKHLENRNIGLDSVIAQQANYAKFGFKRAYGNIRYEGEASAGESPGEVGIVDLATIPFSAVESYDRAFFPDERTAFLRAWLEQPESVKLGFIKDGKLAGYGMIRPCRRGYKIGPLFADAPTPAEALFVHLKAAAPPGSPIYLDVPEVNEEAKALAERQGMKPAFETARMYAGEFPELPLHRLFGVTSFELG